jgi:hypothetical protein
MVRPLCVLDSTSVPGSGYPECGSIGKIIDRLSVAASKACALSKIFVSTCLTLGGYQLDVSRRKAWRSRILQLGMLRPTISIFKTSRFEFFIFDFSKSKLLRSESLKSESLRSKSLRSESSGSKSSGSKSSGLNRRQIPWLRGQDLNLRPSGYEPDELPDCSTPRLREAILAFLNVVRKSHPRMLVMND